MLDPVLKNPWVRALGALLALCAVAILLFLLKPVLVPLFFAFIVAYVLDPAVDFFEARKVRRGIAIGLFAFIGITLLLSVPLYVVPSIVVQADQLVIATQKGIQDEEGLYGWFRAVANRLPLDDIIAILDEESRSDQVTEPAPFPDETAEQPRLDTSLEPPVPSESEVPTQQPDAEASPQTSETDESAATPPAETERDPFAVLTEIVATKIRASAVEFFQSNSEQLASAGVTAGQSLAQFLATAGRRFIGVFLFFGKFFLFAFVAGYLLKDYDRIVAVGKGLLPLERRDYVADIFSKIDGQLRSVLRGQAIVCLFLAAIYTVGLTMSGVPFAVPLGIFGGMASIIPYMGIIATIGPSVLFTIQMHGIDWHVGGVAATFIVGQMLEATVITPRVVGQQVGLSPVWVILSIVIFGNWLGFLGLLLAVPIAASLKVLVLEAVAYYRRSVVYTGNIPVAAQDPPAPARSTESGGPTSRPGKRRPKK